MGTRKKVLFINRNRITPQTKSGHFVPSDDEIITVWVNDTKHYQKLVDIDGLGKAIK